MLARLIWAFALVAMTAPALPGQEPPTREEEWRREREAKAQDLKPPQYSRLERGLLSLENGRVLERLLNPAEGFFPKIGHVTPGSGLGLGPGYRKSGLLGGTTEFTVFAAASLKRYWIIDGRIAAPQLADGSAFVEVHAQRYDFPLEKFFGLGPDSNRDDETTFGFRSTVVGGSGGVRPRPWLSIGGGIEHLSPTVGSGTGNRPIGSVFGSAGIPGLSDQPNFFKYEVFADLNYREPRGNPRGGGRYRVSFQQFDDRDGDRYGFHRFEADLQQYISLLRHRRVLALHAFTSLADADQGQEVPFYLQRTLGGPDDLRGFRRFRFRDRNILLLQAEYRWEIFPAMDGAIFYDAGKVAPRTEDIRFNDLESDYGIGFRFGTDNGVFLRIEAAFGSSGGKHFVLRFNNVF